MRLYTSFSIDSRSGRVATAFAQSYPVVVLLPLGIKVANVVIAMKARNATKGDIVDCLDLDSMAVSTHGLLRRSGRTV